MERPAPLDHEVRLTHVDALVVTSILRAIQHGRDVTAYGDEAKMVADDLQQQLREWVGEDQEEL